MEIQQNLPRLYKTVGKSLKEPHQCVKIEGAEIWKNRLPQEWHLKLPPASGLLLECPDGQCQSIMHCLQDECFMDPWCLPVLFKLQKGMKILVLIEYCKKSHVAFFTFDHAYDGPELMQLYSAEDSKDCYFFTPYSRKNIYSTRFGVSVQWACVHYLAIVDSKQKSFGKFGGFDCFKEELAKLTKTKENEVTSAIERLSLLNPMPARPILKPIGMAGTIMKGLAKGGSLKNIKQMLSNTSGEPKGINELAYFLVYLSSQGKFSEFMETIGGWQPVNPQEFTESLKKMVLWYLGCAPTQTKEVSQWWQEWDNHFSLGRASF